MENKVLNALQVAKQTIDGWTRDSEGRVTVHPDVISKAVNAAIAALEEASEHESNQRNTEK